MKQDNTACFLKSFVKKFQIPVTHQSIIIALEKLHGYPGLFEMNDVLTACHITVTVDHLFVSGNINGYGG